MTIIDATDLWAAAAAEIDIMSQPDDYDVSTNPPFITLYYGKTKGQHLPIGSVFMVVNTANPFVNEKSEIHPPSCITFRIDQVNIRGQHAGVTQIARRVLTAWEIAHFQPLWEDIWQSRNSNPHNS